ncbi:energy transducer TonB [Acidicapsa acidisoli]|uniref:energy transducer TonB n=1 Tax=Acidicapsa acidisoli TaxID=1615681 RepID=UPI0021E0033C|nr:energy transducer TonB [Acidicapsa acidisoli]
MFEDATFHSRSIQTTQTSKWMVVTLTLNVSLVAVLIAYPLLYPESLPSLLLRRTLYAPPPALAAQAQPQFQSRSAQSAPMQTMTIRDPFAAPSAIPTITRTDADSAPPPTVSIDLNRASNGVPDADGPVTSVFHPNPPPAVRPAPPRIVPVSGGVIEGYILSRSAPLYPAIARTVGVSGTVALAATISKSGTIENLRILSGHPMLCQAAIDAVQQWRYRPYLLNGQPVEVETTINIVLSLGSR